MAVSWPDAILASILAGVTLLIYIRTLAPGLLPGDSGEFQTLATLLGHTHPTGYPVYLAMAKPFTWLPVGDIAYRINLFSAVMGAATVVGLYLAGRLLTGYRWVALVGALALAVSPTFWSQALIAEVYTPGAAFFVFILVALLWWEASGKPWALFWAGLLGGLSLGVHMSVVLLAPAALLFLLLSWRQGKEVWRPLAAGAAVGLALAVLAFLLLDLNDPPANYFNSVIGPSRSAWELSESQTDGPFDRLLFGWSAQQFRPFMFSDPATVMARQAADYWRDLPDQLSQSAIILAIIGAVTLLVHRPRLALLLLLALTIQWLFTFNYAIWDLYVFYIPGYLLLALLATVGLGGIVDGLHSLIRRWPRSRAMLDVVIAALALIIAVWPVFKPNLEAVAAGEVPFEFDGYPVDAYSRNTLHPVVNATVLDLPENAIIFTDWDLLYPYYYVAHIEQDRTDLMFIETYPRDDVDGLAKSVVEYVIAKQSERPVYVSERLPELVEVGYDFAPARIGPTLMLKVYHVEDD
jgi:hypothetical protein